MDLAKILQPDLSDLRKGFVGARNVLYLKHFRTPSFVILSNILCFEFAFLKIKVLNFLFFLI